MSCWALIAVKGRASAKHRLAPVLTDRARRDLVEEMLQRVIQAARHAATVDCVAIVSPEKSADDDSLAWIQDAGQDLNTTLEAATEEAHRRGAVELLVLPADLPLVTAEELDTLVLAGRRSGVALAPDRGQTGTNALYVRLPLRFRLHFGIGSWRRHLAGASRLQDPQIVRATGLAFDVDEPDDLSIWPGQACAGRS
jgi:2-phospho-L-lactate guanylyltransferase